MPTNLLDKAHAFAGWLGRIWPFGRNPGLAANPSDSDNARKFAAQDTESRLRALVADASDRGPVAFAHLQLLNLSAIRERVGARWPRVRQLVHLLTETTLYRHLGPDDFFFVCREDVYVVAFPSLTPDEAAAACQRIVDEISNHLFGVDEGNPTARELEAQIGQLDIVATSFSVEKERFRQVASAETLVAGTALDMASRNVEALSTFDPKIEQTLGAAESYLSRLSAEQPSTHVPEVIRRLGSLIDQLRALERELMGNPLHSTTRADKEPAYQPIEWQGLEKGYDFDAPQEWKAISGRRQAAMDRLSMAIDLAQERLTHFENLAAAKAQPAGEEICWQLVPDMPISYTIDYLPMLETRRSVVAIYLARIRFRLGDLPATLDELLEIEDDLEVRAVASRLLARAVVKQAEGISCPNSLRAISVDDAIFRSAPHRRTFFEFISHIDQEIRHRLVVEVVLHESWQPLQIEQSLLQLRPFCRAIFLRLPDLDTNIANPSMFTPKLKKAVSAIGVAVPNIAHKEKEFLAGLKKFVLQCEQSDLNTYLVEVPTLAVFMNAIGTGITFTCGTSILPACNEPSALHKTTIEDIFAAHAPASRPAAII